MKDETGKIGARFSSGQFTLCLFFILVFFWTWSFWIFAAASSVNVHTAAGKTLLYLGLLGPTVGGISFANLTRDTEYRREYWARIIDFSRIRVKWSLITLLFMPALMTVAVLLSIVWGGSMALPEIGKNVLPFLSEPSTIAPFVLVTFIKGPLLEELGWRGYALDQLQARWSALASSLILGVIWAIWHLPLFFMKGMYHNQNAIGSVGFWLFLGSVIPLSIIITWIFNNTRRSTLAAILFHFMANVSYEVANLSVSANINATVLIIASAIVIVTIWGSKTLTRNAVE